MREHLYKAKRIDNGEWVEGYYVEANEAYGDEEHIYGIMTKNAVHRIDSEFIYESFVEVDPNTVCEYVGKCDKNGKKIFEGDIVKYTRTNMFAPSTDFNGKDLVSKHLIYWNEEKHCFYQDHYTEKRCIGSGSINFNDERAEDNIVEIIGNKFDNPEFLEGV